MMRRSNFPLTLGRGPHLYFLVDLLKHPGDHVLTLHRLDLVSGWPDVFQKYLLSLGIDPWGEIVY